MLKLITLTIVLLYGSFCWGTMPSACFTMRNAVKCQSVQFSALYDMRNVNWPTVYSVR